MYFPNAAALWQGASTDKDVDLQSVMGKNGAIRDGVESLLTGHVDNLFNNFSRPLVPFAASSAAAAVSMVQPMEAGHLILSDLLYLQALYPAFAEGPRSTVAELQGVLEVHLRRLDGNDYLHRRAMALISIEASHADVWAVLTDYERLPDIVPDLLSCERLPGSHGRGVRLRQA